MGKHYLYCPRGPLFLDSEQRNLEGPLLPAFLGAVRAEGGRGGSVFLKIEPAYPEASASLLERHGFRRSKTETQPSKTVIMDLSKPEDGILSSMKPKTRYNIRLAQKKGLAVKRLGPQEYDLFLGLLAETARRDRFTIHPKQHYKLMLALFAGEGALRPAVELWGVEHEAELLAVNLVMLWGKTATYLHGASSSHHRELMAPYLLHWQIMRRAKEAGYAEYDLWGISEKWPGVTRFKEGFGGNRIAYVGSHDLVFDRLWYLLYQLARGVI